MKGALYNKQEFLRSEEAAVLRKELQEMVKDPQYNTATLYLTLPEGESHFVEKYMTYMSSHLRMDHKQYVLNLKLMTRQKAAFRKVS